MTIVHKVDYENLGAGRDLACETIDFPGRQF